MERVMPPTKRDEHPTAKWTEEGKQYMKERQGAKVVPHWEAGFHYVALESPERILLPELPALQTLRHRWFWQRRHRPYVPVWSFAKVPRATLSPEENARLLSVYMRPWTLNPADATEHTPLLSRLRVTHVNASVGNTDSVQDRTPAQTNVATLKRRRIEGKQAPPVMPGITEVKSYVSA